MGQGVSVERERGSCWVGRRGLRWDGLVEMGGGWQKGKRVGGGAGYRVAEVVWVEVRRVRGGGGVVVKGCGGVGREGRCVRW